MTANTFPKYPKLKSQTQKTPSQVTKIQKEL